MEYYCEVWAVALRHYLYIFDRVQKQVYKAPPLTLSESLEPLAHLCNVASLSLFCRYYLGKYSTELAELTPFPLTLSRSTRLAHRQHHFVVSIPIYCKEIYANSFFSRTAKLWNSLPVDCFLLTYNLNHFTRNVSRNIASLMIT